MHWWFNLNMSPTLEKSLRNGKSKLFFQYPEESPWLFLYTFNRANIAVAFIWRAKGRQWSSHFSSLQFHSSYKSFLLLPATKLHVGARL